MAKARREEADGHTHGVMTEWEEQDEKPPAQNKVKKNSQKHYRALNIQH